MSNFWDSDAWGSLNLIAILLVGLLVANALKKNIKFFQDSLIPTSVLAGIILLTISSLCKPIWGTSLFETEFFSNKGLDGISILEIITYHALALGFISQTLIESPRKFTKKRSIEVFNTGVTTVSTYLIQGVLGMGATILISSFIFPELFPASGILLPFGFGQGSGQALNFGSLYETDHGFAGGKSFGLSVAALGFLCASLGGVIHLHVLKKTGKYNPRRSVDEITKPEEVESKAEIPMNGTIDKLTVQIALILVAYIITNGIMIGLSALIPSMQATIYGFNFLFGVLSALLVKFTLKFLRKHEITKKQYTNNFLLTHISNMCFDVMIVAGIAAIRIELIKDYWWVLLIISVLGYFSTYYYNKFIARKFFPEYSEEQFLTMFGMLTGTASTGIMLLREVDPNYETPASDNLVYQNLPAIVFGFPMMLIAKFAPENPLLTFFILLAFFVVMNIILFRSFIFKKRKKKIK